MSSTIEPVATYNALKASSSTIDPLTISTVAEITVFAQEYSLDYSQGDFVKTISDSEQLEMWQTALSQCTPHRMNHPRYDETYLAVVSYADGEYEYILRIDSADDDNVDLVPFITIETSENAARFDQGNYRCEGLQAFVETYIK